MTLPYYSRLLCLLLGSFFLVYLATALVAAFCSRVAIGFAERLRTRTAARFLLGVRLLPLGLGVFIPLGLCLPSYLWLEPSMPEEAVGIPFLVAAALGAVLCVAVVERAVRIAFDGVLFLHRCRRCGYELLVDGHDAPILAIDSRAPFLALAGVLRPRIVISEGMIETLSTEELAVALLHEEAHRNAWDNWKRFGISLVPLPLRSRDRWLEKGWIRAAEFAADEEAVGGDPLRALALASALVRVARGGGEPPSEYAISFLGELPDLSLRVDRLLAGTLVVETPIRRYSARTAAVLGILVGLGGLLLLPPTFHVVQALLERVIR